jgi:hypothetical protein
MAARRPQERKGSEMDREESSIIPVMHMSRYEIPAEPEIKGEKGLLLMSDVKGDWLERILSLRIRLTDGEEWATFFADDNNSDGTTKFLGLGTDSDEDYEVYCRIKRALARRSDKTLIAEITYRDQTQATYCLPPEDVWQKRRFRSRHSRRNLRVVPIARGRGGPAA